MQDFLLMSHVALYCSSSHHCFLCSPMRKHNAIVDVYNAVISPFWTVLIYIYCRPRFLLKFRLGLTVKFIALDIVVWLAVTDARVDCLAIVSKSNFAWHT